MNFVQLVRHGRVQSEQFHDILGEASGQWSEVRGRNGRFASRVDGDVAPPTADADRSVGSGRVLFVKPLTSGPIALTIAGFDPSSGAGITADIKTMAAYGIYGVSCVTALTVQSTSGVSEVQATSSDLVRATLNTLADDLPIRGVKIGMLATAEIAQEVVDFLALRELRPVVVDPVLASSSGMPLLETGGWKVMLEKVIGRADVFTPNAIEAGWLSGKLVNSVEDAVEAGTQLLHYGPKAVIVKGGHLGEHGAEAKAPPTDTLVQRDADPIFFPGERIATASTHGTGCTFATAILCEILLGRTIPEAVSGAKRYVTEALRAAKPMGKGSGPMEHFWVGRD